MKKRQKHQFIHSLFQMNLLNLIDIKMNNFHRTMNIDVDGIRFYPTS